MGHSGRRVKPRSSAYLPPIKSQLTGHESSGPRARYALCGPRSFVLIKGSDMSGPFPTAEAT